jgi:hypothetical protein
MGLPHQAPRRALAGRRRETDMHSTPRTGRHAPLSSTRCSRLRSRRRRRNWRFPLRSYKGTPRSRSHTLSCGRPPPLLTHSMRARCSVPRWRTHRVSRPSRRVVPIPERKNPDSAECCRLRLLPGSGSRAARSVVLCCQGCPYRAACSPSDCRAHASVGVNGGHGQNCSEPIMTTPSPRRRTCT